MNLQEIREKYPQYNHASDQELADALHKKYYSHAPKETFYSKIGFKPDNPTNMPGWLFHGISSLSKKINPDFLEKAGSIAGDFNQAVENAPGAIGKFAGEIPENIGESASQFAKNPIRTATRIPGNILSTLLEGGKGAYNLPLNIQTYLGKKGIPGFKEGAPLAESLKIGDTGLEKAVLGQEEPGDVFWKKLPLIYPALKPASAVTSKALEMVKGVPEKAAQAMDALPPIRAKAIMEKMSGHKAQKINEAKEEYGRLWEDAAKEGITHVPPTDEIIENRLQVLKHTPTKHHQSLDNYLTNPTLENAHWAQSELGSLIRHYEDIYDKQGLSPSQQRTLRAARKIQNSIHDTMFSNNHFGIHPELEERYTDLSNRYKKEVIPYKRLEELSAFEKNKMRPKTAVKKLKADEEFMIQLAKRYPGLMLHSKAAKELRNTAATAAGLSKLTKFLP